MTEEAQRQARAERKWWRARAFHLYYVVVEREDLVRIVAVWGAMKGATPSLIEPLPSR